jgi:hypothetical protein
MLNELMEGKGVAVEAAKRDGTYLFLEAEAVLEEVAAKGVTDGERLRGILEPAMQKAAQDERKIRLYGELVALIWSQGHRNGAMTLERLWSTGR